MDNTWNDLVLCHCALAWSQYFSVLPSRGWISQLGLLLILTLVCCPAAAQQDHPRLRLLVLQAGSQPTAITRPAGVDDTAVPALSTSAARRVTASFIGRPIDNTLLTEIRDRLAAYYVSIDRPFVSIAIAAQDIAAGTLRVNITEIKRGRVRVEGNQWFDDRQYLDSIRAHAGDPINIKRLAQDTDWINGNSHRHATIAVEPGDDPSTYDLAIQTKDTLPLDVTLAADNTGTTDTGLYRLGLAVDWTNALWRGDDLNYGFLTSPDRFRLLEHALSYTAYLPWRDSITLTAVIADTNGHTPGSSDIASETGRASILSFRYNILLASFPDFTHHIELGYDFKTTNTNIVTGGNLVFPTSSDLDQFVLVYTAQRNDPLGLTAVTAVLTGSPGHLTSHNTEDALASQQPGASPSYVYGRLSVERQTRLPLDAAWSTRITGQYSSDVLLPSEQLVFGGIRSIRGFVELGATRDEGILMQNELRLAPVKLDWLRYRSDPAPLLPFIFLDMGAGRNHLELAGLQRSSLEMVSVGPGLTWQFAPNAALRFSWGFPLIRNGHTGQFLGPQFGTQITF